jgi:hypothetical protein
MCEVNISIRIKDLYSYFNKSNNIDRTNNAAKITNEG